MVSRPPTSTAPKLGSGCLALVNSTEYLAHLLTPYQPVPEHRLTIEILALRSNTTITSLRIHARFFSWKIIWQSIIAIQNYITSRQATTFLGSDPESKHKLRTISAGASLRR